MNLAPAPASAPVRYRRTALLVLRAAAATTLLACLVQIAFAGLGAYGASFDAHRLLGQIIQAMTVLVLASGVLARPTRLTVGLSALLALLAIAGQSVLAELGDHTDAWFGALHAVNGLVIIGLLGRLVVSRFPLADATVDA